MLTKLRFYLLSSAICYKWTSTLRLFIQNILAQMISKVNRFHTVVRTNTYDNWPVSRRKLLVSDKEDNITSKLLFHDILFTPKLQRNYYPPELN